MKVRKKILEQYYQHAFGIRVPDVSAYAGATFDEYFELIKISYPAVTPRKAAMNSPESLGFRQLVSSLDDNSNASPQVSLETGSYSRKAELDISQVQNPEQIQTLLIDKVKQVRNWADLDRLKKLCRLWVFLSGTQKETKELPTLALEEIKLVNCSIELAQMLLASVKAITVFIEDPEAPVVNLEWIKHVEKIESLTVLAACVVGYHKLTKMPLRYLYLANANTDSNLWSGISGCRRTLQELLMAGYPFAPSALPDMPALRRLTLEAFEESRDLWIAWAVQHPDIQCRFVPRASLSPWLEKQTIVEIYRSIPILQVGKGRSPLFRIGMAISDLCNGAAEDIDTDMLETSLTTYAKRQKMKVRITSNADELVLETSSVGNCRTMIDQSLDAAGCGHIRPQGN